MIAFEGINYVAVLFATLVYYFIGITWYTLLFRDTRGKETGTSGITPVKPSVRAMVGQFLSTFLYVLGIAVVLRLYGTCGIIAGITVSVLISVLFVIPINSGNHFFTGREKLFLIDVCERIIGSLVVGIILGVWR
jgi:hypothetical protein